MPLVTSGSRKPIRKYTEDEISRCKDEDFVDSVTSRLDRLSKSLIGNGGTDSSGGTSSRTVVSKYATYRRTKSDCHPSTKLDDDVIVYFDRPTKSSKSSVDPASEYRPQSSRLSEASSSGNRWYQYGSIRSRKDRENEYARTLINARIQKLDPEEARAEVIHRILDRIREDPDLPTIDNGNRRSARAELNSFASKIGKFSLPADPGERFLDERDDFRSRIAVNRGELAKLEQLVNYTFDHREDFIYNVSFGVILSCKSSLFEQLNKKNELGVSSQQQANGQQGGVRNWGWGYIPFPAGPAPFNSIIVCRKVL